MEYFDRRNIRLRCRKGRSIVVGSATSNCNSSSSSCCTTSSSYHRRSSSSRSRDTTRSNKDNSHSNRRINNISGNNSGSSNSITTTNVNNNNNCLRSRRSSSSSSSSSSTCRRSSNVHSSSSSSSGDVNVNNTNNNNSSSRMSVCDDNSCSISKGKRGVVSEIVSGRFFASLRKRYISIKSSVDEAACDVGGDAGFACVSAASGRPLLTTEHTDRTCHSNSSNSSSKESKSNSIRGKFCSNGGSSTNKSSEVNLTNKEAPSSFSCSTTVLMSESTNTTANTTSSSSTFIKEPTDNAPFAGFWEMFRFPAPLSVHLALSVTDLLLASLNVILLLFLQQSFPYRLSLPYLSEVPNSAHQTEGGEATAATATAAAGQAQQLQQQQQQQQQQQRYHVLTPQQLRLPLFEVFFAGVAAGDTGGLEAIVISVWHLLLLLLLKTTVLLFYNFSWTHTTGNSSSCQRRRPTVCQLWPSDKKNDWQQKQQQHQQQKQQQQQEPQEKQQQDQEEQQLQEKQQQQKQQVEQQDGADLSIERKNGDICAWEEKWEEGKKTAGGATTATGFKKASNQSVVPATGRPPAATTASTTELHNAAKAAATAEGIIIGAAGAPKDLGNAATTTAAAVAAIVETNSEKNAATPATGILEKVYAMAAKTGVVGATTDSVDDIGYSAHVDSGGFIGGAMLRRLVLHRPNVPQSLLQLKFFSRGRIKGISRGVKGFLILAANGHSCYYCSLSLTTCFYILWVVLLSLLMVLLGAPLLHFPSCIALAAHLAALGLLSPVAAAVAEECRRAGSSLFIEIQRRQKRIHRYHQVKRLLLPHEDIDDVKIPHKQPITKSLPTTTMTTTAGAAAAGALTATCAANGESSSGSGKCQRSNFQQTGKVCFFVWCGLLTVLQWLQQGISKLKRLLHTGLVTIVAGIVEGAVEDNSLSPLQQQQLIMVAAFLPFVASGCCCILFCYLLPINGLNLFVYFPFPLLIGILIGQLLGAVASVILLLTAGAAYVYTEDICNAGSLSATDAAATAAMSAPPLLQQLLLLTDISSEEQQQQDGPTKEILKRTSSSRNSSSSSINSLYNETQTYLGEFLPSFQLYSEEEEAEEALGKSTEDEEEEEEAVCKSTEEEAQYEEEDEEDIYDILDI